MFDKWAGMRDGRERGKALRILHLASSQGFWSGKVLLEQAKILAYEGYRANILRNKEKYESGYLQSFVLAYTNTKQHKIYIT